ncbi:MAG: glycosyltransferase family 1 protein [Comamonadaceae bacterium]|nr:MAG: glycosyltransferase family 1 protein [Comamonadaceae bacterium]
MQSLIVYSHLRWNFVYQRPQHVLSRLAARWPVIYIEEPVPGSAEDYIEVIEAAAGVQVWRPHLAGDQHGMHTVYCDVMRELVANALSRAGTHSYWLWFYTPMALPYTTMLEPEGIVYDCMDELSLFRGAPPELLDQEAALLDKADLVFTGGRSLYLAKRDRHHAVHCFPSSVDAAHFRPGVPDHALQAAFAHPRLGYCGVIDERIDLGIIEGIALAHPDWQLVMVGPTAKIDPASLPRLPNIHWLGQQAYADLPAFICGWDICLLPFALNDATRFISPTKTLEYMACGKPCVSTAIRDVVEPYSHVVSIRADAAGFVEACETILARTPAQAAQEACLVEEIISGTSWDGTAAAMGALIAGCSAGSATAQQDEDTGTGVFVPPVAAAPASSFLATAS